MLNPKRIFAALAVLVLAGVWYVTLAPTVLGGSTSYILVSGHSMEPLLHTGDLAIVRRQSSYAKGDVIAYRADPGGGQVIHRIVGWNDTTGFSTKGDNRTEPDMWTPRPSDVIGRMWVHVPAVGTWVARLRQPQVLGILVGLMVASSLFRSKDDHKNTTGDNPSPAPGVAAAS